MPQYEDFIAQMGNANYHGNIEAPACTAWTRPQGFDPLVRASRAVAPCDHRQEVQAPGDH
jgi:hypothetical protein